MLEIQQTQSTHMNLSFFIYIVFSISILSIIVWQCVVLVQNIRHTVTAIEILFAIKAYFPESVFNPPVTTKTGIRFCEFQCFESRKQILYQLYHLANYDFCISDDGLYGYISRKKVFDFYTPRPYIEILICEWVDESDTENLFRIYFRKI